MRGADYDNDGDLDLIIANGTPGRENYDFLYRNDGKGKFVKVKEGAVGDEYQVSAGTAWADYDNDGDLDLFVANWGGDKVDNNSFYVNKSAPGPWLAVKIAGVRSNRFGVGTRVRVRASIRGRSVVQTQQVSGQTGYGSQSDVRLHFGLEKASRVSSLELFWPSGLVERYSNLPTNQIVIATEGRGLKATDKKAISPTGRSPVKKGTESRRHLKSIGAI